MERIQADGGVRAVQLGRDDDPLRPVAADVGDQGAARFPKGAEEALCGVPAAAFVRTDQAPMTWSMTTVICLCPRRQLSSSIPILLSPSRRSRPRETSSTTRLMILPTVCQCTRMSWLQALWEHCVASHA